MPSISMFYGIVIYIYNMDNLKQSHTFMLNIKVITAYSYRKIPLNPLYKGGNERCE